MEQDVLDDKIDAAAAAVQEPESEQEAVALVEESGQEAETPAVATPEIYDEQPLADDAVETAEAAVPVGAEAVDHPADVSDIFGHTGVSRDTGPDITKEMYEQLLQEVTDLSGKVALLSTATAASTVNIQKISDETGQLISWSEDVKGVGALSKLFQIVTLLVLVLLLAGISYLAVRQYQINHHLHTAETAVAEAIKTQQKQIAEYDKHFADLVGSEISKEREASIRASVQERLNRLRNGLAEQQLYRKNNGDWFVVSGKNEVPVADPDIIQELNQAFVRSGRVLITPYLVPPHKVVSFLRPNGQGGTDIVVTKELAP